MYKRRKDKIIFLGSRPARPDCQPARVVILLRACQVAGPSGRRSSLLSLLRAGGLRKHPAPLLSASGLLGMDNGKYSSPSQDLCILTCSFSVWRR